MQEAGEGFLDELTRTARRRVASGYYELEGAAPAERLSLVKALLRRDRVPIMAEVKLRSPAEGKLTDSDDVEQIALAYERAGASGISVLTEPEHFDGRLGYLSIVKQAVRIPVMMKDVVVDGRQVDAAQRGGADALLLIAGIFGRGALDVMLARTHAKGMEAVVEVHDEQELELAMSSEADVIGVNNRDLNTLAVSVDVSRRLLRRGPFGRPVVCESGINSRQEIDSLRSLGADGFLIGTALMRSKDPESTLRKLSGLRP